MDNVLKNLQFKQRDEMQVRLDALHALLLNRSFGDPGLAIHGSTKDNLLTAAAFTYLIGGKPYSKAAQTEITTLAATAQVALTKCWYLLCIDSAGAISFVKGVDAATGDAAVPAVPASKAVFGAVHVSLANAATFTLGTTAFDATDVTSTYFDVHYVSTLAALGQFDNI